MLVLTEEASSLGVELSLRTIASWKKAKERKRGGAEEEVEY